MVVAVAVGSVGRASRPWVVVVAAVLAGVGALAVGVHWRRVCGSVVRATTAAVASSSMEGKEALARTVAAAGVLLVLSASVLGLALVPLSVPVPVLDFGAARVVAVVAGVRRRLRSLRPAGASVP